MIDLPEKLFAIKTKIYDERSETIIARVDNPNETECSSEILAEELVRRWNLEKKQGR